MNNVNLIGHVATDVKVGNGVISSLLAVHRIYKSSDGVDTDFIPLSIFGHQAENFQKMVSKGQQIGIDGQIKTSTYTDQNGEKKYGWSVVVSHFYLLGSGNHDEGSQQKISQQMVNNDMHSSSAQQQRDLYSQYHQQKPTPQPVINKQLDDLDSQLTKAGIPFD
ncbi:single-stranded DNA-binding protein [Schleiferilactobacillus harbinensis]|uniref:single-stranded DNA-binding protein n=1 Tax=Schleiferilactobacillus harbinensis TaxID=304207 RepID=UPI0039EC4B52